MGVPPELSSSMGGFLILLLSAAPLLVLAAQAKQQQGLQSADLADAGGSLLKLDLNKLRTRRDANPGTSAAKKKSERVRRKNQRKNKNKKDKKKKDRPRRRNKFSKKKGKGKKSKAKQKDRKRKRNKNKKNKKDRKKKKSKRGKRIQKQETCSSNQADYTCMEAALKGLVFENNQIQTYLKQAKLMERHHAVSGNKVGKKNIFLPAEEHLLWAVGGDINNPKCGPNDTTGAKYNSTLYEYEKNLAVESYNILMNCTHAIQDVCDTENLEGYDHDEHLEDDAIRQALKKDAIANNKRCHDLTEDAT